MPSRQGPVAAPAVDWRRVTLADLLALVHTDPAGLAAAAGGALAGAGPGGHAVVAAAEWALGLAAREQHQVEPALRHLRRAVRTAERHGLAALAANARNSLAGTLAMRGSFAAALRELDLALPALDGRERAMAEMQRASVLRVQGRFDDALAGYRRALPVFRRLGDEMLEAMLLHNRAPVFSLRGAARAAEDDLTRAEALLTKLGQVRRAADVRHNLGYIAAIRGDLPAALAWFDRADQYFDAEGLVDGIGLRDRCEALLAANLVDEARQTAERAVRELGRHRMAGALAEARLLLAEAALLGGDAAAARAAAAHARRAFARQRRPAFALLARYVEVRVAGQAGERSPRLLGAARRAAAALDAAGWDDAALHARLIAGQTALALGRPAVASRLLDGVERGLRRGPAVRQARAWHAVALRRLAGGDRRGAAAALRAGLGVIDRYRAALGASDLRAHVAGHAAELARLGVRLALDSGDPVRLLRVVERWRAGGLAPRPVRPPDDPELADDLARLRQVTTELERAPLRGGAEPEPGSGGRDLARLRRRQARLEEVVRARARHGAAAGLAPQPGPPPADRLAAALGDRALVELVELDGSLLAVTLAGGRARLRALGQSRAVAGEVAQLRFALRRLAHGGGDRRSLAAAGAAATYAAERLDRLVLGPVRADVGDRPLVVSPTGPLHALPWAALPSCAGRPVAVVPSAGLWLRATGHAASPDRVALAAGPGLPQAAAEIAAVNARYPAARALTGESASVAAVLAAIDGAGLAHVAAHGRFRADNPLLSSLWLADGPLTVYDLETLAHPPRTLVLSACDAGLTDVRPGGELMGLAAALLTLGTRTLVAPVVPIPDDAAVPMMVRFHDALLAGRPPAEALAVAAAAAPPEDPAARSFVCLGAG